MTAAFIALAVFSHDADQPLIVDVPNNLGCENERMGIGYHLVVRLGPIYAARFPCGFFLSFFFLAPPLPILICLSLDPLLALKVFGTFTTLKLPSWVYHRIL